MSHMPAGKPKLIALLILSIGLLAATLWLCVVFSHDPVYSGKPMSQWVQELGTIDGGTAITRWGQLKPDIAAPHLIHAYARGRSSLRKAYLKYFPGLPGSLRAMLPAPANHKAIQRNAIYVLCRCMGSNASPVMPLLLSDLKDKDPDTRREAASELGSFRRFNPASTKNYERQAVKALTTALQDSQRVVRENAAGSLYEFGPAAKDALPSLKNLCTNDTGYVQCNALIAVWKIEKNASFVTPLFVHFLEATNVFLQDSAAQALAEIGPPAKFALEPLKQMAETAEPFLRLKVLDAIWEIDQDETFITPLLSPLLQNSSLEVKKTAASLLIKIKGENMEHVE